MGSLSRALARISTMLYLPRPRQLVVAALAVAVVALSLAACHNDRPAPASAPSVITVDGPDANVDADQRVELDSEARGVYQDAVRTPDRFDLGGGLRGADDTPVAEHEGPLATPSFPGCETRILRANWSNRTSAVRAIGLHYTAGGNRPGKSDMDGLTAYANSPSAGVSWHFLIDAEGHCYYSVPLDKKAWTIGNLNSQTVNIEVIGTGREGNYPAASAGARKLAAVVQRLGRIYSIPMRVGAVSNCRVTRPGIVTHWQGGACSGGHHDIRPYDIETVVAAIRAASCDLSCLRDRHEATHRRIRRLACRTEEGRKTHPVSCRRIVERNRRLHGLIARERRRG